MIRGRRRSVHIVPSAYPPGFIGSKTTAHSGAWDRVRAASPHLRSAARPRLTVSVAICTRNRPTELKECLEHVSVLTPRADEVIVVDNSSGDRETEHLAKEFGARYIVESAPGLSRARNKALAESRCDIVAYLDDDCIPEEDWLEYLLQPFSDDRVAASAGEIVLFTSRRNPLRDLCGAPGGIRYVNRETPRWFEMASFGGIGDGGNMAFRKRACGNFQFFDERLGRGTPLRIGEEGCAFVSLLALGHATVRIPSARVYHPFKLRNPKQEEASAIAYSLLLFSRFPHNRMDLLRFLVRRALRRTSAWRGDNRQNGDIVSSGWNVKLRGILWGVALFLRAKGGSTEKNQEDRVPRVTVISSKRPQPHLRLGKL